MPDPYLIIRDAIAEVGGGFPGTAADLAMHRLTEAGYAIVANITNITDITITNITNPTGESHAHPDSPRR